MRSTLEVKVVTKRLPLSRNAAAVFKELKRYDRVLFTSRNAEKFFNQELRERGLKPLPKSRVVSVGPRKDLLKFPFKHKLLLFPRSDIAPFDIVRELRRRGARVRTINLYTTYGASLSRAQMKALMDGSIQTLYFRSPSGIGGLLEQFPRLARKKILKLKAICIGGTTAESARMAGFENVSIKGIM